MLTAMGMLKVKACDLAIHRHLRDGKDINDETGTELARNIAHESLQMERIRIAAGKHGFDEVMLAEIYQSMVSALMPEPLIRHGGPILAPSLIFMDDAAFEGHLHIITEWGALGPAHDLDFGKIKRNAAQLAVQLKTRADTARGAMRLEDTPPGGCGAAAAVMLGIGLACALASAELL